MKQIPNENLKEDDLPPPNCADRSVIVEFALSFDGYDYWGSFEKCAEIAGNVWRTWRDKNKLPNSLTLADLRTCLFFEQREAHWDGGYTFPTDLSFALIEEIRGRIRERETGTSFKLKHGGMVGDEDSP